MCPLVILNATLYLFTKKENIHNPSNQNALRENGVKLEILQIHSAVAAVHRAPQSLHL